MSVLKNQNWLATEAAVIGGATACQETDAPTTFIFPEVVDDETQIWQSKSGTMGPFTPDEDELNATNWIIDSESDKPPHRN